MTNSTPICDISTSQKTGLRRADWRFLLPAPESVFQHLVLLGGPADLPERIIESGIARRVSVTLPADGFADAIAVLSDAQVQFRDAASCLMPGGALYYEVDRRSPAHLGTTPRQVQNWLRRVGLTPIGVYWAAPDFANCRRYIPLDSPEALQWYLSTLFVAGTSFHRLLEIGLRLYPGNQRFASIAPCFAVTAIADATQVGVAPSVLGHLSFPTELKSQNLHPVVLTSGQDDGSRVVILPFESGNRQPTAVIKVATNTGFNRNTEWEQATLTEVRSLLNGNMRRTIPRPLGLLHYGELAVGIESYAHGNPLLVTSGRWHASFQQQTDDLRLAANWLYEFHQQIHFGRMSWGETAIERWIETPLTAYAQTFGLTAGEKRLFTEARNRAWCLAGATLPLIWMHYDFGPWNLYRNQNEFTVIDWEFGRNRERDRLGPALYDLLYFVTYWNHVVQHINSEAAELQGFCRLFIQADCADKYSNISRQVIADYMTALDIDRRFLPLLLVYMWVDQALIRYARKQALGEIQTDARAGNRSIGYIAVLARHVEQLFAGWNNGMELLNPSKESLK